MWRKRDCTLNPDQLGRECPRLKHDKRTQSDCLSGHARQNDPMLASWPVVSVDDWSIAGLESQGQHPHDWLKHPSRQRTWLFKPARAERDRSLSEDVVEKLGSEFAQLVGVPAAPVELAIRDGVRGALVEDVRLPYWELQAGQALMPEVVPDYDPNAPGGVATTFSQSVKRSRGSVRRQSQPCRQRSARSTPLLVTSCSMR